MPDCRFRGTRAPLVACAAMATVVAFSLSMAGVIWAGPQASPAPASSGRAVASAHGFWEIALAGGAIGYVIMFLSVAAMALAIEHAINIRAAVLIPPRLTERVRELLAAGQTSQALAQCKLRPSLLAYILNAGLSEIDGDWPVMEKAMEDAAAEQSARLMRKIEYLSVIANLAPMLGLLGTVIGMVVAFRQVAISGGTARAADLAEGIYLALVTTVEGLIVAIPALAAFAFFRNRVDQLVSDAVLAAQSATAPLRRQFARQQMVEPPPLRQVF
jgi:biopolymer transport protein ExbB